MLVLKFKVDRFVEAKELWVTILKTRAADHRTIALVAFDACGFNDTLKCFVFLVQYPAKLGQRHGLLA